MSQMLLERYESRLKAQRDFDGGLLAARLDGFEEGELKGQRAGALKGRLEFLKKSLQFKFGQDGHEFMQSIHPLEDPATLDRIMETLLSASSVEHFREALGKLLGKTA